MENFIFLSKIYDYLHLNGMTQKEFYKKSGISEYMFAKIQKGDVKAILCNLEKLASAIECEPVDLINVYYKNRRY